MSDKRKEKKSPLNIDFGIGKLNLGGLFNSIDSLVDLAQNLEDAGGEIKEQRELKINGRKGIFGFSVRNIVGKDGKKTPIVQPFGNIKKTGKGTVVKDAREPIVDIFKMKNTVQIVAELPGVLKSEIKYSIKKNILTLSTTGSKKYSKEIVLPYPVSEKPIKNNYNAGIWELELKKKK